MSEARNDNAIARLSGLVRSGRLADEFDAVPELLAGLSDADLLRAGPLISRVDPDAVRRAHPAIPEVSVVVTGSGNAAPAVAPIAAQVARHGLVPRCSATGYDTYTTDLLDDGSPLRAADIALCLLDAEVVFAEVQTPWQPEDVERAADAVAERITGLAERFAAGAAGTLVLTTLPLPRTITARLVDHRSRARLGAVWRRANARLLDLAERVPRVVVLDLDPLMADGAPAVDARMAAHLGLRLSPALVAAIAREIGHLARHVAGRTRKALVLDLDDTLWSGVLGEVGADGVEVSPAHAELQRAARQFGAQGVLLAVVSKNDPVEAAAALDDVRGMALRQADFVRVVANWRPKPDNMAELAAELNLGLESLVFVDDNPAECGMVRAMHPAVRVVELAADPAERVRGLLADGWFDVVQLTAEDRARPAAYRADLDRGDLRAEVDSVGEYLRALDVRVDLSAATPGDTARLSQLTLRTNQFNMTTLRLSPGEVDALLRDPDALVLAIRSADRFGDNGLVGAVFLRTTGLAVHIDNALLSCRVFGRGIEQAWLARVLRVARDSGADAVLARYSPSARNGGFADFFPRNGFRAEDPTRFRHDLVDIPDVPAHITLIDRTEGVRA